MNEWFYTQGGQQKGPVSFNELAALARNGTLDAAKDLVWTTGMKDWQPAGTVDGLFGKADTQQGPAADPSNPYAAPQSGWDEPTTVSGQSLQEIEPGSEPIDLGACVKRGFELTKRHFGTIILVGITYLLVTIAASFVFGALDSAAGWKPSQQAFHPFDPNVPVTFKVENGPIESILSQILSIFLSLGLARIGLNLVSGNEVSVAMMFGQGRKLLPAIGASILYGLMVVVGILLLVVPGIYLALRYGQFMNAMVDRNLGVIDSLKYSSRITTNNRLNLFLLALLSILIVIAGLIALIVGVIFAYPVVWLSWMVAYRWMQYGQRAAKDHPGTTTPLIQGA